MRRLFVVVLMLLIVAVPTFAKTHKENYTVTCAVLWPAVKDTLRNSGKYGIVGIDNGEMNASFNIGGTLTGKRTNSVLLNGKGDNACEMQVQTAFSGLVNNDFGDFKKRVDDSLAKLQAAAPAATTPPATPPAAATPATTTPPAKSDKN